MRAVIVTALSPVVTDLVHLTHPILWDMLFSKMKWLVVTSRKTEKQLKKLPEFVKAAYAALAKEMEEYGPYRSNWSHYGKLKGSLNAYHCHISSGRPTYVVCWTIKDKTIRLLEVYYVGTHENAPY